MTLWKTQGLLCVNEPGIQGRVNGQILYSMTLVSRYTLTQCQNDQLTWERSIQSV